MKKITLTKEHLKLIPFLFVQEWDEVEKYTYITKNQLFSIGNHILESVAMILGYTDLAIPNTKDDADGMAFPQELEDKMMELVSFFKENLIDIERIIHQFSVNGGVTEGTYEAVDEDGFMWEKIS